MVGRTERSSMAPAHVPEHKFFLALMTVGSNGGFLNRSPSLQHDSAGQHTKPFFLSPSFPSMILSSSTLHKTPVTDQSPPPRRCWPMGSWWLTNHSHIGGAY